MIYNISIILTIMFHLKWGNSKFSYVISFPFLYPINARNLIRNGIA